MPNKVKEIFFKSDNFTINGFIHIPEGKNRPFVIGSHGLLSDASSPKQVNLAMELNKKNIGYLRIDHRGIGKSEGILENTSLETRKEDLQSAFFFLKNEYNPSKIGLFGSSMGGATCINANDIIKPHALVLLASPVIGKSMKESFTTGIETLMNETGLSENFFIRNIDFDLTEKTFNIKNILVVHGDSDEIVPFSNGRLLYNNSGEDKDFLQLEKGDHRVTDPKHQQIFQKTAIEWFIKHLE